MVMAVLIIFSAILQTVINLRMLSVGGQGARSSRWTRCESRANSAPLQLCILVLHKYHYYYYY